VHYGVTMGDGAELGADAFLMKGSEVPPHTRWAGNPAEEVGPTPAAALLPTTAEPAPPALTDRPVPRRSLVPARSSR
jgi:hypothetical protein